MALATSQPAVITDGPQPNDDIIGNERNGALFNNSQQMSHQRIAARETIAIKEEKLRMARDFRRPDLFYPNARKKPRKILYRFGPTNSGKTHDALDKFFNSTTGIYCAPLRLMAKEVFEKCQSKNFPCDLRTGEEVVMTKPDGEYASHFCCTVHCADLESRFHVAIIDEVQMLADPTQGWAFTRALLGLQADRIILCGDCTGLELVRRLLDKTRDFVETKEHLRPTPLLRVPSLDSTWDNVHAGDCLVFFSKKHIREAVQELHRRGISTAKIYGSLPPEVKKQQALLFNNEQRQVLVATDAIGMGLNYNIRRIIFMTMVRFDNETKRRIVIPAPKVHQIAGRAGRMKQKNDKGEVTSFKTNPDYNQLQDQLDATLEPSLQAGILPSGEQLHQFYKAYQTLHEEEPLEEMCDIMKKFEEMVVLDKTKYRLCDMEELLLKAQALRGLRMGFLDMYRFCLAPVSSRDEDCLKLLRGLATLFSKHVPVTAKDLFSLLGSEDNPAGPGRKIHTMSDLKKLEMDCTGCSLYMWLHHSFPKIFNDEKTVQRIEKSLIPSLISGLDNMGEMMNPRPTSRF